MSTTVPADKGPFLNGRKAVAERYGKSTKWVQRAQANPDLEFPKPRDVNGYLIWSLPELVEWDQKILVGALNRLPKAKQRRERTEPPDRPAV